MKVISFYVHPSGYKFLSIPDAIDPAHLVEAYNEKLKELCISDQQLPFETFLRVHQLRDAVTDVEVIPVSYVAKVPASESIPPTEPDALKNPKDKKKK